MKLLKMARNYNILWSEVTHRGVNLKAWELLSSELKKVLSDNSSSWKNSENMTYQIDFEKFEGLSEEQYIKFDPDIKDGKQYVRVQMRWGVKLPETKLGHVNLTYDYQKNKVSSLGYLLNVEEKYKTLWLPSNQQVSEIFTSFFNSYNKLNTLYGTKNKQKWTE